MDYQLLECTAKRVNWYTTTEDLVRAPKSIIAQVMSRGNAMGISAIQSQFSLEEQREAYLAAPPGLFDRRSWAYWELILFGDPKAFPFPERFAETSNFTWQGQ